MNLFAHISSAFVIGRMHLFQILIGWGNYLSQNSLFAHCPSVNLVYPLKFCIAIVFAFSWDDCNAQEKLKTMLMQKLWGLNKMCYGQYSAWQRRRKLFHQSVSKTITGYNYLALCFFCGIRAFFLPNQKCKPNRIAICLPISYRACIATAVHFSSILIFLLLKTSLFDRLFHR